MTALQTLSFFVAGLPITQGSMKAFVIAGRARVTANNGSKLQAWRHAIATEARRVYSGPLIEGPVIVRVWFGLLKPASAPKKRRTWPIGARSGDVDKLGRSLLDALTGVIWCDDAQVIRLEVEKDWGVPGARIEIHYEGAEVVS